MIKERILSQSLEVKEIFRKRFVERSSIESFRKYLESKMIKVIVGPRRAGKSFLSFQLIKNKKFGYVNFDDEEIMKVKDYNDILKCVKEVYGDTKLLFFDEIQNLDKWELFVNRLRRSGYNIVITGSNSRLLSRELATHLTGRYIQIPILTFSFEEFLRAIGFKLERKFFELKEYEGKILNLLDDFLKRGGYPEVIVENLDYRSYVKTLLDSIIFKDVVKRYNLRFPSKVDELAKYVISNCSNEVSFSKLKNILQMRSVHTVENYLKYLQEAFLIVLLNRFSPKVKEQIRAPKKVYVMDNSMITSTSFRLSENIGKLMENAVFIELLRRSSLLSVFEIFYYKFPGGKEIDFLVKEGLKIKQLIQVTYASSKDEIDKREIKALIKGSKELKCKNLLVITWGYEAEERFKGKKIKFKPLWKWLLGLK